MLQLVSFQPFADTAAAVAALTAAQEGQVTDALADLLEPYQSQRIAVADKALAVTLASTSSKSSQFTKIEPPNDKTTELFRWIRTHWEELASSSSSSSASTTTTPSAEDVHSMRLGLSHAVSRYKLKFSADKVDTMIIQGIGLLDELDKEINVYAMRTKEWYGWHFPELQQLVSDNARYARLVTCTGHRHTYATKTKDLASVFNGNGDGSNDNSTDDDDEVEAMVQAVQQAAEVSMGTDVTDLDILHIQSLAEQVLSLTEYRSQLYEYLHNRMHALAPNLTILTGELVGARLIAHAGSLLQLAKQPASTIQIAGAEKALFRALKTKHDTPKYGLLYHASLVGQAAPAHKGKISRVLAAKAALAVRVDALTDGDVDTIDPSVGHDGRAKVQARLRQLEQGNTGGGSGGAAPQKTAVYHATAAKQASGPKYNAASDLIMEEVSTKRKNGKEHDDGDDDDDDEAERKRMKKEKKKKKKSSMENDAPTNGDDSKKRKAAEESDDDDKAAKKSAKKAKKAKKDKKKL